jgi:hypothetical protein
MATAQDYRQARRTGQISLTDLIARNIAEGGGFGSVGKAVSQKFAAKRTRIREAFDPLNIASMMVGRTKLGTAILGRMMGRSAEDIQYFARKGAGREAAYDPFFARVGPGSLQPVKQNDGTADVFAKIYNLLKKNIDDETKRREVEKNFKEEEALEDERRHKELLAAIAGSARPKATPVDKKEGGGLLDFIKGMFANFMDFLKPIKDGLMWLFNAVSPLISLLGKGLMSVFKGLLDLGLAGVRALVSFMASPFGLAILAGVAVAYLSSLVAEAIGNWENKKIEEKGGKAAVEAQKEVMKAPAASPIQESYDEFGGTQVSDEAQMAAEKRDALIKEKQDLIWQKMTKKGYPVRKTGFFGGITFEKKSGEQAPEELVNKVTQEADAELEVKRKKAQTAPQKKGSDGKTPSKGAESSSAGSTTSSAGGTSTPVASTAATPSATPAEMSTAMPSVPTAPPVATATDQNMQLEAESMDFTQSAPMIFNKSSTNGINLGGQDAGTATGAAPVRDDALGNIINKLQRRGSVM